MPSAYRPAGGTADHVGPQIPATAAGEAVLLATFPHSAVLAVPFGSPVGRDWFAECGCEDPEVSGQHIRFEQRDGQLCVVDVGSRNGTWLQGKRLVANEPAPLIDGSVLRLGRTLFVYREHFVGAHVPSPSLGQMVGPFGLRRVAAAIDALSRRRVDNVLIEGETGTGKELVAHEIARALGRGHPFAPLNVAGVSAGLFESQLFGHVSGAFTGAQGASKGVVIAHDGGAIFLDEIGELPLSLQPKLLRLLDNRELLPVGADRPVHADVLILAATNQDLGTLVSDGAFRRDLHARLAMARIVLPPLRERCEDIPTISRALVTRLGGVWDTTATEVEAIERLVLDPWPSNIRGLLAALGEVTGLDPSPGLRLWEVERVLGKLQVAAEGVLSRQAVRAALAATGGNESKAARHLGITRGKLRRFLAKLESI